MPRSATVTGHRRSTSARPKARARPSAVPYRQAASAARATQAPRSELQRLRDTLGALDSKVSAFGAPINQVRGAIRDARAPLDLPPKIIRALDDSHTALSTLRLATSGLGWVPGPIGTGAKAADRAIKPFLQPPPAPHGLLRNSRGITADIDRALKPVREALDRIEGPIDRAAAAIDAIDARLAFLVTAVDRLLGHYGAAPPPGIEACAAQLNAPLQIALEVLLRLEAEAGKALAALAQALQALLAGLKPLIDVAAALDKALAALAAKPIRDVLAALRKLVSALEPYRRWSALFLERVLASLLKKIGISLAEIDRFFDRLIDAVNPLKPIAAMLASARARLAALAEEFLAAIGAAELLAQLESLQQQVEREIDAFLQSACGGQMLPKALPAKR